MPSPTPAGPEATAEFIARWQAAQAAERANYALFLSELCDVLGVERPHPTTGDPEADAYVFEKPVRFADAPDATLGRIDLYKRGCFVLETKQGADEKTARKSTGHGMRGSKAWERAMTAARQQAARYARNLGGATLDASDGARTEPVPPFLVVVDVGYSFDLYADFSGQGRLYKPFPAPGQERFLIGALEEETVRERLRLVFENPHALDPTVHQARVTKALAGRLARVAATLERDGHAPDAVFGFLSRCLFTMFAEDVGLLPDRAFTKLLASYRDALEHLPDGLAALWRVMDEGGYAPELRAKLRRFNGSLFHDTTALPLSADALDELLKAARQDWRSVEPAIFGTLLERALDPEERHHLGAHYTPRAYVERLVGPAVVEPLEAEWEAVQTAVAAIETEAEARGTAAAQKKARTRAVDELTAFLNRLATVRVLDPACGSGNFLYVTLDHLKRLEGEVRQALAGYGAAALELEGVAVTPAQLLGLEVNPRAAAIADLVLWIGYLQGQIKQHGGVQALRDPVLEAYGNIRTQDAVLGEDGAEAAWPEADFIVGNPPFIGASRLRDALGDAYAERLWRAYEGRVPQSADYVAFWWDKAAQAVRDGRAARFGFITTNSLSQTFNRRVVERHVQADKAPLALVYAVADHPWVDGVGGAAVRIAMTVGARAGEVQPEQGRLAAVVREEAGGDEDAWRVELQETRGRIHADLTTGVDVTQAEALKANADISSPGLKLHGAGFIVPEAETAALGLGTVPGLENHLRPYRNGRDLTATPRGVYVIDLFGLNEDEVRERFPAVYEHVLTTVKPERDKKAHTKDGAGYAKLWWLHGKPRQQLRPALSGLSRYIATVETAKHRFFQFLDAEIAPDNKLIVIASDDAYHLGVLSSIVHVTWALAQGSNLGVGNDPVYVKTRCFETFPFPEADEAHMQEIRRLGDAIDAHRKARQVAHPSLTLTDLYNAVEALRAGRTLTSKEQVAADQGFAATLLELHRRLDAAVLSAYGWPESLSDSEILERLVALNAQRRAEEAAGVVRYLRPTFQAPEDAPQTTIALEAAPARKKAVEARTAWPGGLPGRVAAVRQTVEVLGGAATATAVAARFTGAREADVEDVLAALVELGLLHQEDGRYVV